ncbi:uncharacterized protein A1O9_06371 [Exophiala aquamarina CBS 119918]|uniref:Uncharacterized protein n=1 Tax=Exophiala aquamarina CBS 119918 TaxID=1182545 RepID=A0A072PSE7_9EURO|nr:uncharacterized protein A1O9_06371 [Exophiala aquamarina CBS 119918]KEF58445.1 hypothetical protein A1O9_06371 [Exophiala aquamarina CBS 119918]
MASRTRFPMLVAATAVIFGAIAAASDSTAAIITSTLVSSAQSSTATTGSYTLCQFYSSIPGATGGSSATVTTLTLPPCPSSIITFSYTDLLPTATTDAITLTSTFPSASASSYTLCQFYSSIPGATSGASTMTLPSCPSDLQTFTYTLPSTTAETVASTLAGSSTVVSGSGLASSFPGVAAPTAAVDKIVVAGVGALVVAAGLI